MRITRQQNWRGLPFLLQWTTFCQTYAAWPDQLGRPHRAWLNFIELDKAVVLVWLVWLDFSHYGFSVSALWSCLATPTVLCGFRLSWTWGTSSWLLQQSAATSPYLGQGISPHCHHSWTRREVAPLVPPVPMQPPLHGCVVSVLIIH